MDVELKTHYWGDNKTREAFKRFILEIHGLDFSDWESAGFWDDAYTPFSFFDGDTVVASVCIYLLDAVIDGQESRLAQISGVGTLPGYRRRGLNRELTEIGLNWAEGKHKGVFLFSDTGAIPFYKKCGFSPIEEFVETIEANPVPNCGGLVKLDPGNGRDLNRIYVHAKHREPVSDRFSVLNDKLFMYHVLYGLRDYVYEIADLDCLVLYERKNGILSIYDIVAERTPKLSEFYPHIAAEDDKVIEFHFNTDKLGLRKTGTRLLVGNHPFVKDGFPFENPVFPFTSRA